MNKVYIDKKYLRGKNASSFSIFNSLVLDATVRVLKMFDKSKEFKTINSHLKNNWQKDTNWNNITELANFLFKLNPNSKEDVLDFYNFVTLDSQEVLEFTEKLGTFDHQESLVLSAHPIFSFDFSSSITDNTIKFVDEVAEIIHKNNKDESHGLAHINQIYSYVLRLLKSGEIDLEKFDHNLFLCAVAAHDLAVSRTPGTVTLPTIITNVQDGRASNILLSKYRVLNGKFKYLDKQFWNKMKLAILHHDWKKSGKNYLTAYKKMRAAEVIFHLADEIQSTNPIRILQILREFSKSILFLNLELDSNAKYRKMIANQLSVVIYYFINIFPHYNLPDKNNYLRNYSEIQNDFQKGMKFSTIVFNSLLKKIDLAL